MIFSLAPLLIIVIAITREDRCARGLHRLICLANQGSMLESAVDYPETEHAPVLLSNRRQTSSHNGSMAVWSKLRWLQW